MSPIIITAGLLGSGAYLFLLGLGKKLVPAQWRGNDLVLITGRVMFFLGLLSLPTCFDFSYSEVRDWIEQVFTTGGAGSSG